MTTAKECRIQNIECRIGIERRGFSRFKFLHFAFCICVALLSVAGCKKDGGSAAATQPTADASSTDKTVNLLIFSEYVPQDVLDDFKKETGIEVKAGSFDNNEELLLKLSQPNADLDLVSPSDYMVRQLAARGLIRKFDRAKLSNFANLDPALLGKSFDPKNEYSLPLFWGTTGIGYNKTKVPGPVDSWAVLFDPKFKGQISMLNDSRELLSAALRLLNQDPNTRDGPILELAISKLIAQKELVKLYRTDGFEDGLVKGDVNLAHGFNGQVAKVMAENPNIGFSVPKEGATLWIDNLSIPTSARRADNALLFLNYLNRPEIAARTANFSHYATPNKAGRAKVDPKLLENPVIYPPEDVQKRCTSMEDLGEANKRVAKVLQLIKS